MGRSGSFIAYDIALKTLMRVGKVSLLDVVDKMRDDRVGLVQVRPPSTYRNSDLHYRSIDLHYMIITDIDASYVIIYKSR